MKILALLTVTVTAAASAATSINLDFGTAGTAPPSSYAAAGTPGIWNNVTSLGATPATGFIDINGDPVTLAITSSQPLFPVTPSSQPFSGPVANLLGDYLVSALNDFTLTFSGLPSGVYRVYTYTVGRQDFPRSSTVTPFGDVSLIALNSGIWAGTLQQGITHSVHDPQITSGGFTLDIYSSSDGFVNGIQIVPIPEPAGLWWLGPLFILGWMRFIRRPA
jgi:hypothetical protein